MPKQASGRPGRSSRLDLEHVHKGGQITPADLWLPGIVQNIDRYRQIQSAQSFVGLLLRATEFGRHRRNYSVCLLAIVLMRLAVDRGR